MADPTLMKPSRLFMSFSNPGETVGLFQVDTFFASSCRLFGSIWGLAQMCLRLLEAGGIMGGNCRYSHKDSTLPP